MRYLKMLDVKGVQLSDMPMTTQKKVAELNELLNELMDIKSIPQEELEEEDKDDIKEIETQIEELDKHIERKVELFDPIKYAKKLEQLAELAEKKKQKTQAKEPKVEQPQQILSEDINSGTNHQSLVTPLYEPNSYTNVPPSHVSENFGDSVITDNTDTPHIQERKLYVEPELEQLKEVAQQPLPQREEEVEEDYEIEYRKPQIPPQPAQYEEDEEEYDEADEFENEFDKAADSKPRKMSKGVILMGVGFFFLTWGAVNYFKDKRQ
jgi:hypothetical protein